MFIYYNKGLPFKVRAIKESVDRIGVDLYTHYGPNIYTQEGRGLRTIEYTGTQKLINIFSYSLASNFRDNELKLTGYQPECVYVCRSAKIS